MFHFGRVYNCTDMKESCFVYKQEFELGRHVKNRWELDSKSVL